MVSSEAPAQGSIVEQITEINVNNRSSHSDFFVLFCFELLGPD